METKHTPGPWHVASNLETGILTVNTESGRTIAVISSHPKNELNREQKPNAQLIAAVPELLEALQEFLDINDSLEDFDIKVNRMINAVKSAESVIKKATS